MKRNMMRRNLSRSILRSLGRYLAIAAIIALGCGIFVGLRITKTDMIATGQEYTDSQNMFDLRLLNSYGWTQEQVDAVLKLDGIEDAEGSVYLDAYAGFGDSKENVYRLMSIPESINLVYLLSGRMPVSDDECLVDGNYYSDNIIGHQIVVSESNDEDTLNGLHYKTYTVVGCVNTPLYMDLTRSSTTLGSGTITTYIYIPEGAFALDYYTEIYVTIPGQWEIYSDAYNDALDDASERLKEEIKPLAIQRYDDLLKEAEQAYADGLAEYESGLAEYEAGRDEALQTLADALAELEAAQAEIDNAWAEIHAGEVQIADAQQQLTDGRTELDNAVVQLEASKVEAYSQIAAGYTELMENYKLVSENLSLVEDGLAQIDDGIAQIDDGLSQIESNLPLLELMVSLYQSQVDAAQAVIDITTDEVILEVLQERQAEQTAQLEEYQSQLDTVLQTKQELEATKAELTAQRTELAETQKTLQAALDAIGLGFMEIETNQIVAENQFAAAQSQINAGYLELEAGQAELDSKIAELEAGKAELISAQAQLDEGWAEYEQGKAEAEAELADAESKLADAETQLSDARQTIDDMTEPDVYSLTRNTNAGYLALDSNSDIVSGISRIMPVFFMLIAALVCITTITRMVEEERTQIGTLKALGYGNGAIIGKYIGYSVSASIIGCAIGVAVGCVFFPKLLWNAYGIILNIRPNVALEFDWSLCVGITAGYIAVSTLVTWYCCRRTLREVPAELIRPKAPHAGKKIFLEYLPFWKKLSFLNKVTLRNVVRYRQRLLMMLVGIGGCTTLLLTGFGIQDTIGDLANIQFSEVNHFDLQVAFSEDQSREDQEVFLQELRSEKLISQACFFHQSSAELDYDGTAREVYLIAADNSIQDYLTFAWNGEDLGMPGPGEAFLSVGITELMDISLGDTITVRNSDMESMTLTVAGIYENYVQNYVVITPETMEDQWEKSPDMQMAFVFAADDADVHDAGAAISTMEDVINIVICEDTADSVGSMMQALDLVVVVIIVCAGMLGAIVLYNLTNININERIREIATIKVLGFNAAETSAYVFKENIVLTVLGAGFGLLMGRGFVEFVIANIKVDLVWFKTRLTFPSYLYTVLLTVLCAVIVNFIFHKRLDKINMAEALKSVE